MNGQLQTVRNNADLLHLHNFRTYQNVVAYRLLAKSGIPYVVQAHGSIPRLGKSLLKLAFDGVYGRRILRSASRAIAVTEEERTQYLAAGVESNRITIIPNGIDFSLYSSLPRKGTLKTKLGIPEDERIILYLGRIHRIKGVDVLVRAFSEIVRVIPNLKLLIVGPDDGYLARVKSMINALGLQNEVMTPGPLYGESKVEALVDCDVFVLPSRYEIFGMSALEASACSKPVVCSRLPGLQSLVVDGVTGVLVDPGNSGQLASSITSLLRDPIGSAQMGSNGKKLMSQKFSLDRSVELLEKLYNQVVNKETESAP